MPNAYIYQYTHNSNSNTSFSLPLSWMHNEKKNKTKTTSTTTPNNPQVMTNLLPGNHSEVVTTYINDVVQQLKANPKVLPVVSTPAQDSRSSQAQQGQDGHHRSPSATRRHKDDSDTRVSVRRSSLGRSVKCSGRGE